VFVVSCQLGVGPGKEVQGGDLVAVFNGGVKNHKGVFSGGWPRGQGGSPEKAIREGAIKRKKRRTSDVGQRERVGVKGGQAGVWHQSVSAVKPEILQAEG